MRTAHSTLAAATAWVALAFTAPQGTELEHGSPQTLDLVGGTTLSVRLAADQAGTIYVWASSQELDPSLRIEREDGGFVAEDDDSGGGTTAWVRLQVQGTERYVVHLSAGGARGKVELRAVASPETEATRAASRVAGTELAEAERARSAKDLDGASAALARAQAELVRIAPGEDSALMEDAWQRVGLVAYRVGLLPAASAAWRRVHDYRLRCLPETHADVYEIRNNLAVALRGCGELPEAAELATRALETGARAPSASDPDLLNARNTLGSVLFAMGEHQAARELMEDVLAIASRDQGDEHPMVQAACSNLAVLAEELGDLDRALELKERVLEVRSRTLDPDDLALQRTKVLLAVTVESLGDSERALELQEEALAVYARILPPEHPDHVAARMNHAGTLGSLGDLEAARQELEQLVALLSARMPAGHPHAITARSILATTLGWLGEVDAACELREQAYEALRGFMPPEAPELQHEGRNLAWSRARSGSSRAYAPLVADLCRSGRRSIQEAALTRSPRECSARAASTADSISAALSLASGAGLHVADGALELEAFSLIEVVRDAELLGPRITARIGTAEELPEFKRSCLAAGEELVRLAREGAPLEDLREARVARDLLWEQLLERLGRDASARAALAEPTFEALQSHLPPGTVLVGYWRYEKQTIADLEGRPMSGEDCLLAFAVAPTGPLMRVELGPIEAVEAAVLGWRDQLGVSETTRGIASLSDSSPGAGESAAGTHLRRLILDPLLRRVGTCERLVVALDDVLHLVPLDALPGDDGAPVGDALTIEVRPTLSETLLASQARAGAAEVLLVGGVDYDAAPLEKLSLPGSGAAATVMRGGSARAFGPLPGTLAEVEGIAGLWPAHASEVRLLTGRGASREAIVAFAPRARVLHLATHGWFSSEGVASFADGTRTPGSESGLEDQARGSSPLLLCGLALAGANREPDILGNIHGALTAEELAALDLGACELAVLSACETNVGIRRAGQGVSSLQKALHMAGAQSAITSLWKVSDDATRELMVRFYRAWLAGVPKARALWQAKSELRTARDESGRLRYSTRDWAGWVLSGDPE